jgi:hypothetical protein
VATGVVEDIADQLPGVSRRDCAASSGATRLELAVLAKDEAAAERALASALAMVREYWEPESTANNLKLVRSACEHRQDDVPWAEMIERELLRMAVQPPAAADST